MRSRTSFLVLAFFILRLECFVGEKTADETYAKHKILQEEEARETPISECVFLSVQKVSSLGAS